MAVAKLPLMTDGRPNGERKTGGWKENRKKGVAKTNISECCFLNTGMCEFRTLLEESCKILGPGPPQSQFCFPPAVIRFSRDFSRENCRLFYDRHVSPFFSTDDDSLMIYGLKCGCSKKKRDENFGSATLDCVYFVPNFAVRS